MINTYLLRSLHHVLHRKLTFKIEYNLVLQHKKIKILFVLQYSTMQLMMYIGNDLIEAVKVDSERIRKPGYLGSFKRCLKIKYSDLIRQYATPPDFLVINNNPINIDSIVNKIR